MSDSTIAAGWWPQEQAGDGGTAAVRVQTNDGQTACGELIASSRSGTLRIVTQSQPVDVSLASVASVAPVGGC